MIKPRIILTGATGKTGSVVVTELLKAGYPVRALVHREDGRSARLKAQGAEIAVADMSDVERVANALKDVQRAYYCPPIDPYMIQGAAAFAVAAKEARLEHIVGMTQWLASPSHPSLIDVFSGIRYYIEDHKRGAFEVGAPTTDVFDVTGRPAEDFETIARRYTAQPRNQQTFGNWLREFVQFMLAPLGPGFDLDRYDRELRRPFPSVPQFATDSKVWRREHAIADSFSPAALGHGKAPVAATSRG